MKYILVLFFYYTGIPYVLFRLRLFFQGPLVRIVAYHDIREEEKVLFEQQLFLYKKIGNIVSPEDVVTGNLSRNRLNILLTFDDGYHHWVAVVLPILEKHHIKALFFVCSGIVTAAEAGKDHAFFREHLRLQRAYTGLRIQGLQALQEAGHTIGGHSHAHRSFSSVSHQAYFADVADDRALLSSWIQTLSSWYAYPFGIPQSMPTDTSAFTDIGYRFAVTTMPGFVTTKKMQQLPYALPRDCVDPSTSRAYIKALMYGVYDYLKPIVGYRV